MNWLINCGGDADEVLLEIEVCGLLQLAAGSTRFGWHAARGPSRRLHHRQLQSEEQKKVQPLGRPNQRQQRASLATVIGRDRRRSAAAMRPAVAAIAAAGAAAAAAAPDGSRAAAAAS